MPGNESSYKPTRVIDELYFRFTDNNLTFLRLCAIFLLRAGKGEPAATIRKTLVQLDLSLAFSQNQEANFNKVLLLHIMGRALSLVLNTFINTKQNDTELVSIIKAKLLEIVSPTAPEHILNKQEAGFHIRWLLNNANQAASIKKQLENAGLMPRSGKIKVKHAIDLVNVQAVEIYLAHQTFKIKQQKSEANAVNSKEPETKVRRPQ